MVSGEGGEQEGSWKPGLGVCPLWTRAHAAVREWSTSESLGHGRPPAPAASALAMLQWCFSLGPHASDVGKDWAAG